MSLEGRWGEVIRAACRRALRHARREVGDRAEPVVDCISWRYLGVGRQYQARFVFWPALHLMGQRRYLFQVIETFELGPDDQPPAGGIEFEERMRPEVLRWVGRVMGEVVAADRARRRQQEVREAVTACTQDLTQDNVSRLFTAWTGFPNPPDDHVSNRAVFAVDPGRPGGDRTAVAMFHGHEISVIAVDEMERWPQQLQEAIHQEAARRYDDAMVAAMTSDLPQAGQRITATEMMARLEEAERHLNENAPLALVWADLARSLFYGGGRPVGRQAATDALVQAFALRPPAPPGEAERRGEALLRAELTPKQIGTLEKHGFFDVIGGKTKRRYRIGRGNVQNVFELTSAGRIKRGLCFAPAGNLVWGDVMLAQKTALELFEQEALAVANEFM